LTFFILPNHPTAAQPDEVAQQRKFHGTIKPVRLRPRSVFAYGFFGLTLRRTVSYPAIKLFILATSSYCGAARRSCAATETGGGDGNRTHVRITNNPKRYMLIPWIYSYNTSKTQQIIWDYLWYVLRLLNSSISPGSSIFLLYELVQLIGTLIQ